VFNFNLILSSILDDILISIYLLFGKCPQGEELDFTDSFNSCGSFVLQKTFLIRKF